ncbi:MAG: sigma-54 dependent transcriptional regulator [Candidatus Pacebacteria bacterium]|nr:sigma-54 dependent transcriptional regulator [Candidatus Paceibacterota bacterium]
MEIKARKIVNISSRVSRLPVCESPAMKEIERLSAKIARSDVPVLVTGESGVGKELIANLIHQKSNRFSGHFVAANVSAFSSSVLESELFGHVRGSFTGANRDRKGLFVQAHKGTLFLDEIGDISAEIQVKLLRVLEEKIVFPVGSDTARETDVRIVTATNCNLEDKIKKGTFRDDFFYRIGTFRIHIPPLRERLEDIVALAEYFIAQELHKLEFEAVKISKKAKQFLLSCSWRGNVRELKSVVTCALAFVENGILDLEHLDFFTEKTALRSKKTLEEMDRERIIQALQDSSWVQKMAAISLGITPRTLNYKINYFGITHSSWRRNGPKEKTALSSENKERETMEVLGLKSMPEQKHCMVNGVGDDIRPKKEGDEKSALIEMLEKNNWSLRATANALQVGISQLKKLIKEQKIKHPDGLWFGSWMK